MPREAMDFAAMGANIGRQLMGGQNAKDAAFLDTTKKLADIDMLRGRGDYYRSQAEDSRRMAESQKPENLTRLAAGFAGLTEDKAAPLHDYFTKSGNWGITPGHSLPPELSGPTTPDTPKAAPDWATPETVARVGQYRAALDAQGGLTGKTDFNNLIGGMKGMWEQQQIDDAKTGRFTTRMAEGLNAMESAKKGDLYSAHEFGTFNNATGNLNYSQPYLDKNASVISENRAQTANAYASAGQHNASASKTRMEMSPGQSTEGFTPGAIEAAAARYNMDGTLPPMGMGKEGALGRRTILNRAAELSGASSVSPDDQRINQIGNKANTAALSKIQQQQTMVGAFEKNFNKNADIALEFSQKVDRTGVPLANKWINAGKRNIGGDPDLAAFDQAIKSASNEYAKIISGSMGNTAVAEGQIKDMEAKLNSAQTPQQVSAVIALMKRETDNRMTAFNDEKSQLRETMKGQRTEAPAPSAAKQPAPDRVSALAEAKAAIAAGAPRAAVIQRLKEMGIKDGAI